MRKPYSDQKVLHMEIWFEKVGKTTCRFLAWPVAISEIEKMQVRFHDSMDGSSLARAIHVPTGPLQKIEC